MTREDAVKGLRNVANWHYGKYEQTHEEDYLNDGDFLTAVANMLKAQEARLVTEADFENADPYGYLPVWVEDKNVTEIVCDCITNAALIDVDTGYAYRFWTSRPTDEQREKEPWNGQA